MQKWLWLNCLLQHQEDGYFGLTPSFLLGAQRTESDRYTGEESYEELRELLRAMAVDTPAPHVIRIAECPKLGQPVAAPLTSNAAALGHVVDVGGEESRLYAWDMYFADEGYGLDSLASGLWEVFRKPICTGHFSYSISTGYRPFSEFDRAFIERAAARDE